MLVHAGISTLIAGEGEKGLISSFTVLGTIFRVFSKQGLR
jgi:hypothetical protein